MTRLQKINIMQKNPQADSKCTNLREPLIIMVVYLIVGIDK